jgi:hypothetical protein
MIGAEFLFLDHGGRASFKKRLTRVIFVLVLCSVIVAIATVAAHEALTTDAWNAVPCTILESKVNSIGIRHSRENPYHVRVTFAYVISGQRRIGGKYELHDGGTDSVSEAYACARQYPPGLQAICYVNPQDASEAVLSKPDVEGATWFLTGAIAVSGGVLWFYCVPQLRPVSEESSVRERQKSTRWLGMLCAILFMCGFGAMFVLWYALPLAQYFQSQSWREVHCTVVESNIMRNEVHGDVSLTLYRTDIHYRYVLDGSEYHSNCFNLTEGSALFASAREAVAGRFPAGKTTVCFVNPHNPTDATLVRKLSPGILNGTFFLAVLLVAPWAVVMMLRGMGDLQLRDCRWLLWLLLLVILCAAWAQLAPP